MWGVTALVFTVLKLTGNVDWSWWLVLSPAWGTFALYYIVFSAQEYFNQRDRS